MKIIVKLISFKKSYLLKDGRDGHADIVDQRPSNFILNEVAFNYLNVDSEISKRSFL